MLKSILLGAAMFGVSVGVSHAADLESVDTITDWTGVYLGVHVGYGAGSTDWVYDIGGNTPGGDDIKGGFGGVHFGYNHQVNNLVFGIEVEANLSGIDGDDPCPNPVYTCSADLKHFGSVRGRLGYALTDWLFYGHGGFALARFNADADDGAGDQGDSDDTYTGWVAGAGIEKMLANHNWTVRAEYSFYGFGDGQHTVDNNLLVNFEPKVHTFRIGLTRKF